MIYSGIIQSKTNSQVPVYASGKPSHSKYNPDVEKINMDKNFQGCLVIAGIAGGFHIANILSNPDISRIIAVEADDESLKFVLSLDKVKEISGNKKITFCTKDDLMEILLNQYVPSLYKNLTLEFLRSWEIENPEHSKQIHTCLMEFLKLVSADYSVQVHFGKLWHRNILLNLNYISENSNWTSIVPPDTQKKAAIIAAGPSLEKTLTKLFNERNSYYIISTDTAYGTLLAYKITPDAVVTVDAQHVSSEHYFGAGKNSTLFILDISSNPETVKLLHKAGNSIFFVRSAHPLSAYISENTGIPYLDSGSGTVTIAAADFAEKAGFREIEFFGADFAYSDGKPYSRGTYLEKKFHSRSARTSSAENLYTALMFRTQLKQPGNSIFENPCRNRKSSEVLESYGETLLQWAERNNLIKKDNSFISEKSNINQLNFSRIDGTKIESTLKKLMVSIRKRINELEGLSDYEIIEKITSSKELMTLLPLFAAMKGDGLSENISLAYNFLLYYNL